MAEQGQQQGLTKNVKEIMKDVKELMNAMKLQGLEIRRKVETHKQMMRDEVKKLQDFSESLCDVDDPSTAEEIAKHKQDLQVLERQVEEAIARLSQLEPKVQNAETDLARIRQEQQNDKENKQYPRARYAVNLYREVSKISWHTEQQQAAEVKGFIRSKSNVKTFCFNEEKQSRHFITNSLWEMGEDEVW